MFSWLLAGVGVWCSGFGLLLWVLLLVCKFADSLFILLWCCLLIGLYLLFTNCYLLLYLVLLIWMFSGRFGVRCLVVVLLFV